MCNTQTRIKELSSYAVAMMLLIDCRVVIGYLDVTPKWWFTFKNILTMLLLLAAICIKNNWKINLPAKRTESIVLLGIYLLCYLMMSHYAVLANLQRIAIVLLLCIYSVFEEKRDGVQELLCKYKNLVFCVAVVSFVLWFMGCILGLKVPYRIGYTSWSGTDELRRVKSYCGVCNLIGTVKIMDWEIPKNASIFTEAPMASLNFCIALMTEVFFEKKQSKVKILFLVLAIISTFSSTGLTFLMMLVILNYLAKEQKSILKVLVKYLVLPIMAVVGGFLAIQMFNAKMTVNSGVIRLDDFVVCFQAWQTKKIFGAGIGNDDYLVQFMGSWRTFNQGLSNSPGQILAHGGLWVAAVYLGAILCSLYRMLRAKDRYNLIYFILFLYLFTITVCSYQYLTYTILIWAVLLNEAKSEKYKRVLKVWKRGRKRYFPMIVKGK